MPAPRSNIPESMRIRLYTISAILLLTAAAIYGWRLQGPTIFIDLLAFARSCF